MREKNIYQCDMDCKSCTYEKKNPTGYDGLDECTTDKCPHNHTLLGNIDRLQGRHSEGYGWNPLGEFCNLCTHTSCEECIKWSNREKKLRNNIPTELKTPKKQLTSIEKKDPIVEKEVVNPNQSVIEQALKIMEEEKKTRETHSANQKMSDMNNTFIDSSRITDTRDDIDDVDVNDFNKEDEMTKVFETSMNDTIEKDDDSDNGDEIDFGEEPSINDNLDDAYGTDTSFADDDDDIPPPNDMETFNENDDEIESNNKNIEEDDADTDAYVYDDDNDDDDDDDDEDYEDYDEDDEAEFNMLEQTRKLKASILFAPGTMIAQYNVRNNGVYLTVDGNSKVTVKGRNDSDGFSYNDPNRFPRYVREGILNGELYKNDNIQITDNSKFIFVYYRKIDDDLIKKDTMDCKTDLTDASEEKIRKLLKLAMDKFEEKNKK